MFASKAAYKHQTVTCCLKPLFERSQVTYDVARRTIKIVQCNCISPGLVWWARKKARKNAFDGIYIYISICAVYMLYLPRCAGFGFFTHLTLVATRNRLRFSPTLKAFFLNRAAQFRSRQLPALFWNKERSYCKAAVLIFWQITRLSFMTRRILCFAASLHS